MNLDDFKIELLDQYWIRGASDPDGNPEDLTSHGKIAVIINGQDISGCEDRHTDYGLNQSALRLLQTVFLDHSPSDGHSNPIFYHGCSIICTCPNCVIDYRVQHLDRRVVLDQFFVSGGAESESSDRYRHLEVHLENLQYADTIIKFSEEVLDFLSLSKKTSGIDRWELDIYFQLRSELVSLLNLGREYIATRAITDVMLSRAENLDVSAPYEVQ